MKSAAGQICTLSLSFNNDGPLGTSNAGVAQVPPCHQTLDRLEQQLRQTDAALTA